MNKWTNECMNEWIYVILKHQMMRKSDKRKWKYILILYIFFCLFFVAMLQMHFTYFHCNYFQFFQDLLSFTKLFKLSYLHLIILMNFKNFLIRQNILINCNLMQLIEDFCCLLRNTIFRIIMRVPGYLSYTISTMIA